jgi:hypothetical protein
MKFYIHKPFFPFWHFQVEAFKLKVVQKMGRLMHNHITIWIVGIEYGLLRSTIGSI